ncbi:MAG: VCBS repeat-containing protein [Candidatus Thorarchaeota archaeon]|nr:VCBS repeat-containing protein [Candidatus Thorarchaeota archaeon]
MASAGGYLNDMQVHIYRWLPSLHQYYPIFDAGDGIIKGDVMDVAFMDSDNNNRLEVVAACADGHIYVFEQLGDQDSTFDLFSDAHKWELVWDSGLYIDRQVWSVVTYDIDHDSHTEIIAGAWDSKVYVFDYIDHSAYPYCLNEHWINFAPVWDSGDTINGRVNSVCVIDSDNDTRMEIVAGSQDNHVYLFEEVPCFKHIYELRWTSGDAIWAPVNSVAASQDLDDDNFGEIIVSAYGQGVFVFDYNHETESFDVRKLNQGIKSWERAISYTTGVYTGYEADEWIDRKVFGWEGQSIYENDPIPAPWNTVELGGASALGGPFDDQETTFDSTEQFVFQNLWNLEPGTGFGQVDLSYSLAIAPDMSFYVTDFILDRVIRYTENFEPILMFGSTGNQTGEFDIPTGITVDEDGFVYVADFGNSRVQKFTPEGDFVASWGENGTGPEQFFYVFDVAVWEDKLYVSDYLNNRIQVLDKETGDFLFRFGTAGNTNGTFDYPAGLTFDRDGYLYVCDAGNDRVQRFFNNGTYFDKMGVFGSNPGEFDTPVHAVVDHDGRIYVSDTGNDRVQKFSPSWDYESEFGASGTNPGEFISPWDLAIYPFGGIIVMDPASDRIQRFGVQEYELLDVFSSHNDQNGAFDVDFDSEGNFYVTDHATPYVFKFDSRGNFILNWTLPEGWFAYAWGVEIDEDDNVFIYDGDYNRVYRYDTQGNLSHSFGVTGSAPGQIRMIRDIALDEGLIYITDYYNNRISIFDYDGNFVRTFGSGGFGLGQFDGPYGIEIGPNDLVYVSERYGYRIQRFYKNGTPIDYWSGAGVDLFMAFDDQGFLYTTDVYNHAIYKYTPDGILIAEYDYEIGNPIVENLGSMAPLGMMWNSVNQSLFIADNDGMIYQIHPSIELNNLATAVVDFGRWEEMGGDATDDPDMILIIEDDVELENMELYISNDLITWQPLELTEQYTNYIYYNFGSWGWTGFLYVDVDHALRTARWDEFRYLKIGVKGGVVYDIDAIYGTVARSIATALVVTTGFVKTGINDDQLKIIIGTVDGEMMAYTSDGSMVWESQSDQPKFSLGVSIWDIVQMQDKGMVPTWTEEGYLLSGSQVAGHIPSFNRFLSYVLINVDGTTAYDLVATVNTGGSSRLIYYQNTGTNDAPVWSYQSGYFVTHSTLSTDVLFEYSTVSMGDLDGDYDDDMILCEAGIDPDAGYIFSMRYFEQTSTDYWTERTGYLPDLSSLVVSTDFIPRITMVDWDLDGDKDLAVATDQLYYFKQTSYFAGSRFYFSYDSTIFQEINDDRKNETVFGALAFGDFDYDGRIDVLVPHASENYTAGGYKCETGRFTLWRNKGTSLDPDWLKTRSMFEPDFTGTLLDPLNGHDYPQYRDMNGDSIVDLICMNEDYIDVFYGTLDHDTFLCATYPYIHMVEVDKRTQYNGYWGYEAFDSWTNWIVFEYWTRSLEYGDVDQDDIPEVFVGSFDHNIIAFEQVANNTYRRSWRSPDFWLQSYMTGEPYPAYMNIRDMVIGDQDKDGKQEIIVCTGYHVYIFEYVEDDVYDMVWFGPVSYYEDYGGTKVGEFLFAQPYVLAVDKDLDGDGLGEIIVGAQNILGIIENTGDNNYTQVVGIKFNSMEAGAPFIKGIETGDINRDGLKDIVVVGIDDNSPHNIYGWIRFISPVKNDDGYEDNKYILYLQLQPQSGAYSLDIADNDLDNRLEVFVGLAHGVGIYEADAAGTIAERNILPTADINYAVRVGNTDGDSWLEVIAGSGTNLTVFEQNQTKNRIDHIYDQVWNSGKLAEQVTDIRLGDSNRNNRMEIIATAIKGYVYAYEWVVNSSAIATSPDMFLAGQLAPPSGEMHTVLLAFLDSIHLNAERMLAFLQARTRRFGIS